MKVVLSKGELVSLIGKIQNVVPAKPAVPSLAYVLLEAVNGQLFLSTTDLTTSMRCFCEATVLEEGALALPARKFFQLVKELASPQVKIQRFLSGMVEITAGSSVFKIHGVGKEEFPELPTLSGGIQVSLSASLLKSVLAKTAFSVAKEENRYVMNGLLLQILNGQASFVGTDGKRLAKITIPVNVEPSFHHVSILPIKAVEEMVKMLDENDSPAFLHLVHDRIFVEHAKVILMTKALTGQYPDVDKVIPGESGQTKIVLHREELLILLRQISLFTTELLGSVNFRFEEGQLGLLATKNDVGEGHVSMPIHYSGPKIEIAFNPFYMQDILRHSQDETITLKIVDSYNPGVVTDSSGAIFVIMPMRLSEPSMESSVHDTQEPASV